MQKLYNELSVWWPLVSNPADYAEEVEFFLPLLAEITAYQAAILLELGSGGGNNIFHMKSAFSAVTLVDLSPAMLAVSRKLNPDCEHLQGDMRTVRLDRTFDIVFIHDAIDYMTTLDDLRQAFATAFIHCKPGGMALFVPDSVRDTFQPSTDHGGDDSTYITDYVVIFREDNLPTRVEHDQHVLGLFARDEWLRLLSETGFKADFVIDQFDRHVFVARKP